MSTIIHEAKQKWHFCLIYQLLIIRHLKLFVGDNFYVDVNVCSVFKIIIFFTFKHKQKKIKQTNNIKLKNGKNNPLKCQSLIITIVTILKTAAISLQNDR